MSSRPRGDARGHLSDDEQTRSLVALVDRWAGYVRSRVHHRDVDDVMQTVRETVLRKATTFDPSLGEMGAWVYGVVRVTVRATRRAEATDRARVGSLDAIADEPAADVADPLEFLATTDLVEWPRLVAEIATEFEWAVVVACASIGGTSAEVAAALGVKPSTVRAARARVSALTRTAITALARRDEGLPMTLEHCVPSEGGYADLLPYRSADVDVAATTLGIAKGVFQTRRAMLRRMQILLGQISESQKAHPAAAPTTPTN